MMTFPTSVSGSAPVSAPGTPVNKAVSASSPIFSPPICTKVSHNHNESQQVQLMSNTNHNDDIAVQPLLGYDAESKLTEEIVKYDSIYDYDQMEDSVTITSTGVGTKSGRGTPRDSPNTKTRKEEENRLKRNAEAREHRAAKRGGGFIIPGTGRKPNNKSSGSNGDSVDDRSNSSNCNFDFGVKRWDADKPLLGLYTSDQVLLEFLTEADGLNYKRWIGKYKLLGGVKPASKKTIELEAVKQLNHYGITWRNQSAVSQRIKQYQAQFSKISDFLRNTGNGLLERDEEAGQTSIKSKCRFVCSFF